MTYIVKTTGLNAIRFEKSPQKSPLAALLPPGFDAFDGR